MKKFLGFMLALSLVFTQMAFSKGEGDKTSKETKPKEKEKIQLKVAYMPNYASLWSVVTGINKGYFAEEGLDITLYQFADGPTEIAAMESGSIDLAYIGQGAHKLCVQGRAKIFCYSHVGDAEMIIGLTDRGIKTYNDLKGKKVGYSSGTSSEVILSYALKAANLTMKDIQPYDMDPSNMVTAMVSGSLDACATWSPNTWQILSKMPNALKLCSSYDFISNSVAISSWICMDKYAQENRDVLLKFTRALYKAMDYGSQEANFKEVSTWVAKQCAIEFDNAYIQRNDAKWMSGKEIIGKLKDGTIRKYYETQQSGFLASKYIQNSRNLDEYIMFDLMQEAAK